MKEFTICFSRRLTLFNFVFSIKENNEVGVECSVYDGCDRIENKMPSFEFKDTEQAKEWFLTDGLRYMGIEEFKKEAEEEFESEIRYLETGEYYE